MVNENLILEFVKKNGFITSKIVKEKGIDSWYLSNLVKLGKLYRVDKGIYIMEDGIYDEYFIFQYKHSKAIYSFSNALYFHDLSDTIPTHKEVTVYQGYNTHRFDNNVRVHYVKRNLYNLGVEEINSIYGNPIQVYDKERTICDLISQKNKMDSEVFKKAIQTYFKSDSKDTHKLMNYASKLGIEKEVFNIVEVLL